VPVLRGSAAYAVSEAFGWKYGLNSRPEHAKQFYAMIALSTLAGMLLNFVGVDTIHALFWTAVINGFVAPPLLVLIMLMASSPAGDGDVDERPMAERGRLGHGRRDGRGGHGPRDDLAVVRAPATRRRA
jgi:Mn2+/Fe2+ NRAMP family transporter